MKSWMFTDYLSLETNDIEVVEKDKSKSWFDRKPFKIELGYKFRSDTWLLEFEYEDQRDFIYDSIISKLAEVEHERERAGDFMAEWISDRSGSNSGGVVDGPDETKRGEDLSTQTMD